MKRHLQTFFSAALLAFLLSTAGTGLALAAEMTVYKSASCGCCGNWVKHMRMHGHTVEVRNMDDLDQVKKMAGVPEGLQSCHTAVVEGYVVEGHVPAAEVAKLLRSRPKVSGLSVPGMPTGSPGMEGGAPERYDVLAFQPDGTASVFARY